MKRYVGLLLLILALVSLGACATTGATGTGPIQDLLAKIAKADTPDLNQALAEAKAANNVISAPCWTAILDIQAKLPAMIPPAPPAPKGAFSALESSMDFVEGVPTLLPGGADFTAIENEFLLGCGPLEAKIKADLVGIALDIGLKLPIK